ncbi:hypothetical protein E4K10_42425 [Streptomyces sp. T1317-0309]|nr:hypothetical protein E4K10_42425 [Streptomyces sp. T1317-0309]
MVIDQAHLLSHGVCAVEADPPRQVDLDAAGARILEGEPQDAGPLGGGEFRPNLVAAEFDAVVARLGSLGGLLERALGCVTAGHELPGLRHDLKLAQVPVAADATEVEEAEALDGGHVR